MATQAVLDLKPSGNNFQRVLDLLKKYNTSFSDENNLLAKLKNQCLFNIYSDNNLIIVDIMYLEYDSNNNTETKLLHFIQERILSKRKVTVEYFSSIDLTKQLISVKNKKLRFSHIIIKPSDILKKTILTKTIDELNKGMEIIKKLPTMQNQFLPLFPSSPLEIQIYLYQMIYRFPNHVKPSIVDEFFCIKQQLHYTFFSSRSIKHQKKILISLHLIGQQIQQEGNVYQNEVLIKTMVFKEKINYQFTTQSTLGILIGCRYAKKNQNINEQQIISAIHTIKPNINIQQGTYQNVKINAYGDDYFYIEVTNDDPDTFQQLKQNLNEVLINHCQELYPKVISLQNDEEIVKNILMLNNEITKINDIPQVIINFFDHHQKKLIFHVTVVKLVTEELIEYEKGSDFTLNQVRNQRVGYYKDQPKEAYVYNVKLSIKKSYIRSDGTINVSGARKRVCDILDQFLGEFRDYNGGMILRQSEHFNSFRVLLDQNETMFPELVEDFFYSITPIENQTTLPLDLLKDMFSSITNMISTTKLKTSQPYHIDLNQSEINGIITLITIEKQLVNSCKSIVMKNENLVLSHLVYRQYHIISITFLEYTKSELNQLTKSLKNTFKQVINKKKSTQHLHLACHMPPMSMDPRIGCDEESSHILNMVFEGLTYIDISGKPAKALAKDISISENKRLYTFTLKGTKWSNGEQVTAYDFEYAWKSVICPTFNSPYSYFFDTIKNAKKIKNGELDIQHVGIRVIDKNTLEVEIEHVAPYFLELVAHPIFSPISEKNDKKNPGWQYKCGSNYVCNGPFKIKKGGNSNKQMIVVRNAQFWKAENV
jgi:oligopeptide transport system substrate-binding protein